MPRLGGWLLLDGGTALGTAGWVAAPGASSTLSPMCDNENVSTHMSPGRTTGGGSHFSEQIKIMRSFFPNFWLIPYVFLNLPYIFFDNTIKKSVANGGSRKLPVPECTGLYK